MNTVKKPLLFLFAAVLFAAALTGAVSAAGKKGIETADACMITSFDLSCAMTEIDLSAIATLPSGVTGEKYIFDNNTYYFNATEIARLDYFTDLCDAAAVDPYYRIVIGDKQAFGLSDDSDTSMYRTDAATSKKLRAAMTFALTRWCSGASVLLGGNINLTAGASDSGVVGLYRDYCNIVTSSGAKVYIPLYTGAISGGGVTAEAFISAFSSLSTGFEWNIAAETVNNDVSVITAVKTAAAGRGLIITGLTADGADTASGVVSLTSAFLSAESDGAVSAVFCRDSGGFTSGNEPTGAGIALKYVDTSRKAEYISLLAPELKLSAMLSRAVSTDIQLSETALLTDTGLKLNASTITAFDSGSLSGFVPAGGCESVSIADSGSYLYLRAEGGGSEAAIVAKAEDWQNTQFFSLTVRPERDANVTVDIYFENTSGERACLSSGGLLPGGVFTIGYTDISGFIGELGSAWYPVSYKISVQDGDGAVPFALYQVNLCAESGNISGLIIITVSFLGFAAVSPVMFPIMRARRRRRAAAREKLRARMESERDSLFDPIIGQSSPYTEPEVLRRTVYRNSEAPVEPEKKKKRRPGLFDDIPEDDEDS